MLLFLCVPDWGSSSRAGPRWVFQRCLTLCWGLLSCLPVCFLSNGHLGWGLWPWQSLSLTSRRHLKQLLLPLWKGRANLSRGCVAPQVPTGLARDSGDAVVPRPLLRARCVLGHTFPSQQVTALLQPCLDAPTPTPSAQHKPCVWHAGLPEITGFSEISWALLPSFPLPLSGQHLSVPTAVFSSAAVLGQPLLLQDNACCVLPAGPQLASPG